MKGGDQSMTRNAGLAPVLYRSGARPATGLGLICDHASAARHDDFGGDLGVADHIWASHSASDLGAQRLTLDLARRLDAPAVLAGFSRLIIDPNRALGDPAAIPVNADGEPVPGNASLSDAQRAHRVDALYRPYHAGVSGLAAGLVRDRDTGGPPGLMVVIHTFTPALSDGRQRPWHAGVLWNQDAATAGRLLADLADVAPDWVVGDNAPYDGRAFNHTLDVHAGPRNLAHVSIEVRQDLVADTAGVAAVADVLQACLARQLTT